MYKNRGQMHGIALFVSVACSSMQLPLTVSQGGVQCALSQIRKINDNILFWKLLFGLVCVCVRVSCYMALFSFRFSFSTFAQFPVTILYIRQIRATTNEFNYSLLQTFSHSLSFSSSAVFCTRFVHLNYNNGWPPKSN